MSWRSGRRERWATLTPEQHFGFLDDVADDLERGQTAILERFDRMEEAIEGWRLEDSHNRNRMLFAIIIALISVISGAIVVPLVIR